VRHTSRGGVRGGVRFHVRDAAGSGLEGSYRGGALHAADSGTVLASGRSIPKYIQSCTVSSAFAPTHVLASMLSKASALQHPATVFQGGATARIGAHRGSQGRLCAIPMVVPY
jgi:hypothetical protein